MGNYHARSRRNTLDCNDSSQTSSGIQAHRLQKSSSDSGPIVSTLRRHGSLEHWYRKQPTKSIMVRHRSNGSLMTRPRANTANSLTEEEEYDNNGDNNGDDDNDGERTKHITTTSIVPVRHLSTSSKRSSQIILPDEEKLDLLNRMHATLRYVIGTQHLVPSTTRPKSVLDVATGAGTWLMEVAMDWPEAQCIGIDKSPLFPTAVMPKNCRFYLLDILEEHALSTLEQSFDFVYLRYLATSIPADLWPQLCKDLYEVTSTKKGMLQMTGFAFKLESVGPAGEEINRLLRMFAEHNGLDIDISERLTDRLTDAGFVDVNHITISLPCGDWGGHVGRLFLSDAMAQLNTLKPLLLDMMLTDDTTFAQLIVDWQNEIDTSRCYGNVYIHTAKRREKPMYNQMYECTNE
ncbi:hypothetical protein BDF22DRAFT_701386 [Syncephalis plumigaleata]|nr:hypothetical protein BDF22DRAFT_701386 [Syncephalis plumigaleata]